MFYQKKENKFLLYTYIHPTFLPVNSVIEVHPDGAGVHNGDEEQMEPDAEIGCCQIAHEKLGNCETKVRGRDHDDNEEISDDCGK